MDVEIEQIKAVNRMKGKTGNVDFWAFFEDDNEQDLDTKNPA